MSSGHLPIFVMLGVALGHVVTERVDWSTSWLIGIALALLVSLDILDHILDPKKEARR